MDSVGKCLRCDKTEQEAPILKVYFRGSETAICSSCLPTLIHRPEQLAGKLEGAEGLEPSDHDHH